MDTEGQLEGQAQCAAASEPDAHPREDRNELNANARADSPATADEQAPWSERGLDWIVVTEDEDEDGGDIGWECEPFSDAVPFRESRTSEAEYEWAAARLERHALEHFEHIPAQRRRSRLPAVRARERRAAVALVDRRRLRTQGPTRRTHARARGAGRPRGASSKSHAPPGPDSDDPEPAGAACSPAPRERPRPRFRRGRGKEGR